MKRTIGIMIVLLALWVANPMSGSANEALNLINGSFVHFGYSDTTPAMTIKQFKQLLNEMRSLGMNIIVLDAVRMKKSGAGCGGGANDFYWVAGFPDKLNEVLDEAHKRGMIVYMGAVMSFMNCDDFHKSPNKDLVYQDIKTNIKIVADTYKDHPAFAGWYIPDETGADLSLIKKIPYYSNITRQLKELTPGKKVVISPYLQPGALSPSDLAHVAAFFRDATEIDIQAWQDGTGAFANQPSSDGQDKYSTEDYYFELVNRLGSEAVWADVELFNFKSYTQCFCCKTEPAIIGSSVAREANIMAVSKPHESFPGAECGLQGGSATV